MKKEDYMKLSKERLAELLAERDNEPMFIPYPMPTPIISQPPCYAPDGICTNPQRDCINCPRTGSGVYSTSTAYEKFQRIKK